MVVVNFLLALAKQGLGYTLAVVFLWVAYEKDKEIGRLNLRILKLVTMQREVETRRKGK